MKEIEQNGKTVEEAVAAALEALGAEREEVEVEVLTESSRGLLGIFGQTEAKVKVTLMHSVGENAVELARRMLSFLEIEAEVLLRQEDAENAEIEIDAGEDTGLIIGRRGETLGALQHLVALLANKSRTHKKRILLNAGGYLERREEALQVLAERTAKKVRTSGRPVTLEALSAKERRIVHLTLANMPGISTSSVGVDPNRRVVISPTRTQPPRPPRYGGNSSPHPEQPPYREDAE